MSILLTLIEIISEAMLLFAMFFALMTSGFKIPKGSKTLIIVTVILMCAFGFVFHFSYENQPTFLQLISFIINYSKFLLCTYVFFKRITVKLSLIVLIIQYLCELVTSFLFMFIPTHSAQASLLNAVAVLVCRATFLIAFYIIWKSVKHSFILTIPSYVLLIILVSIFLTGGLIRVIEFKRNDIELQTLLIKILAFANTLCLIVVLVSLLTNVLFRQYQKDINKILENQVQIQLKHYEKSEKINTEIRRFRHDYNNHMNCMKSLVQSGRYDELMDYINNISDAFPQSGFLYNTGNYIADAILTDKLENARKNGTNISFKGIISPSINNTDLCIILGNILDNAVEACEKIDGEKEISVFGGYQHGYFILIAKNPISCHVQTENGIPATTKPDIAYHGFGLQNVESVVKKYDGIMLPECSDDSFTIRLTFNSIQETATV